MVGVADRVASSGIVGVPNGVLGIAEIEEEIRLDARDMTVVLAPKNGF